MIMVKDINYYMSLNYKIEIIEDKEEGGFAFHCPELPGCMTSADTLEDGYKMIQDAKQCWITACLEDGIEIPEPLNIGDYSGQLRLRMPRTLHRTLSERSKREGVSMNQLCIYLLSGGVGSA
jgi:predicted RNase H-like HicB family nuclease